MTTSVGTWAFPREIVAPPFVAPRPGEVYPGAVPLLRISEGTIARVLKPIPVATCMHFVWVSLGNGEPLFGEGNSWSKEAFRAGRGYVPEQEGVTGACDPDEWEREEKNRFFQASVSHACKLTTRRFPVEKTVWLQPGDEVKVARVADATDRGKGVVVLFEGSPWLASIQCWVGDGNATSPKSADQKLTISDLARAFGGALEFRQAL